MRINPLLASLVLLVGCGAPQDGAGNEVAITSGETDEVSANGGEATVEPAEQETPVATAGASGVALANSAWRVSGEDGAIYTSFLDADGGYRDLKNGDPWQDGTWERLADGRLCFMPSDEGRAGDCWTLGKEKADGALPATSDAGRKVRLQRVTYIAAEAETDQ